MRKRLAFGQAVKILEHKKPRWVQGPPCQLKGSLAATLVDKKAIKKIYLKIKVYMCSTTGDVALTNISQETKYYNDPVHQPWLRSYHIPSMFLNLGHFQLHVLKLKKIRIKKKN